MRKWVTKYNTSEMNPPADICSEWLKSQIGKLPKSRHFFVKCASQNVGDATLAIKDIDRDSFTISIMLDFNYDPDEWSVECYTYDDENAIINANGIHSNGA